MSREARRGSGARLALHYLSFNLSAGMEYRTSFVIQVLGMILNNASFIVFWLILYSRLGQSIRGYGFGDVMFLWALSAAGFGLAAVFLGNAPYLSRAIYSGELDVYLLQPKPVLANFLLSRMSISGWGDLAYGLVLFVFTQALTLAHVLLFLIFSLLMALVLVALRVLYHSLTFFLGNAEELAGMASEVVLSFALYPGSIFEGPSVYLLHTLIPAALVAYIPARLFQSFDLATMALLLAGDLAIMGAALLSFRLGLRVYASANRVGTRT
jgi:ABC-2 type transport system permease protein